MAVIAKHVTDAIAQADPGPNTLAAWEASAWSPGYTANFDWIDRDDPFVASPTIASFQAAYEVAMAPKRKVAAEHWFGEIERAFMVDTGIESAAAGKLCSGHYRGTGNDVVNAWFGFQPDVAAVQRNIGAIRSKPGLSAQDAQYWIAETCRALHERTIDRRISVATDAAAVSGTFAKGERLAVRSPEGELKQVDPEALVKAAAVDGLQVVVMPGGMFSAPGMRVRPFGQTAPALDGKLKKAIRGDGVEVLEVVGLQSLPELDGPMATVECLGTPVQEAFTQGQARMLQGYVGALFGASPSAGGQVVEDARRTMLDVKACDAAKTAFKRLAVDR